MSDEAKVATFMWIATTVTSLLYLLTAFLKAGGAYAVADTTENRHEM